MGSCIWKWTNVQDATTHTSMCLLIGRQDLSKVTDKYRTHTEFVNNFDLPQFISLTMIR